MAHTPVLLNEVLEYLDPKPGQKFIDATINGGGHALAILEKIKPNGKLLGIEWDSQIYKNLESKIENLELGKNFLLSNESYVNLKKISEENGFIGADGILFDLGMSSWHLEESGKGFSFQKDEPLDMRYNSAECQNRSKETAAEIINYSSFEDLARILKEYGEERFAKRIAEEIVKERKSKKIVSAFQLVEVIKNAVPFWYRTGRRIPRRSAFGTLRGRHYATKTFQALRIAVNHELENIERGLDGAKDTIGTDGKIAVITFHSLEDRIVKNYFRKLSRGGFKILTKKPIRANLIEVTQNPRSRSAKLRIIQRS